MNATETVTETARNTNPIDASRRMSDANVVSKRGGRVTVKKIGSVNTPRAVIVAVYYEDVVRGVSREATSDVARLRSSRAEYRERAT